MKGVPIRVGIGQRDLDKNVVEVARRDTKEKTSVSVDGLSDYLVSLLDEIQDNLLNRAKQYREDHYSKVDTYDDFKKALDEKGGFVSAHWDGTMETELKIKEETKASIRCIPVDNPQEDGVCIYSGKKSTQRVIFAKAY
jgi:prolyl-tRNA synthetase